MLRKITLSIEILNGSSWLLQTQNAIEAVDKIAYLTSMSLDVEDMMLKFEGYYKHG